MTVTQDKFVFKDRTLFFFEQDSIRKNNYSRLTALVRIQVDGEPGQDNEEPHHEGGVLLLLTSQGQYRYQEGILHFTQQKFLQTVNRT
jgi:hypothetical protein